MLEQTHMSPPRHGEDSQCPLKMEPTYVMLGPEASQANKYSFLCAPITIGSSLSCCVEMKAFEGRNALFLKIEMP